MKTTKFILIGGFLGAGKTTTIGRLAKTYQDQGLKVGIVTNDQATDLVDTHQLRSEGFDVGEVAGSCFCCNFNELTATVERLSAAEIPDVILAEPVGSCTDIVATVIQPLAQLHSAQFSVAPYAVLLKPSHGLKILRNEASGFSPKAAYIFRKQLEEADLLLINRTDALDPAEVDELQRLVQAAFPGTPVLRVSAKTGAGFDQVLEFLEQRGAFGRRILELDYDIYAEGEAELGWLNSSLTVNADAPLDLDGVLLDLVGKLRASFSTAGLEAAHLKCIGLSDGAYGVVNLVSSQSSAELSLPSRCKTSEAQIIVNARVAADPDDLQSLVRTAVEQVAAERGFQAQIDRVQSFRPGRPVPTHRYAEAK